MLTQIFLYIYRQFLSPYIQIDEEKVSIALWSGSLSLENVRVRADALDFLDLPIVVEHGVVGTLTLSADWARFHSVPVKVRLADVTVLVRPRDHRYGSESTGYPTDFTAFTAIPIVFDA